jgi:uncharacterized membrane protein
MATIRNPLEWGADFLRQSGRYVNSVGHTLHGPDEAVRPDLLQVRSITVGDLREALAKGVDDFAACRTDVVFICLIYPLIGLVLARMVFQLELLPLLFPITSGFALLGPVAAVGLYEMSRRREQGKTVRWVDAFAAIGSPAFGAIVVLGIVQLVIFLLWLAAAQGIYDWTVGPAAPVSLGAFIDDVVTTEAGWIMIVAGIGVGFLFAVAVLTISVVSFPLLLDRNVGVVSAVATSVAAVVRNPLTMAVWGFIIAAALVIGSIPLFLGLIVIMPILGHATWHLYRRVVV